MALRGLSYERAGGAVGLGNRFRCCHLPTTRVSRRAARWLRFPTRRGYRTRKPTGRARRWRSPAEPQGRGAVSAQACASRPIASRNRKAKRDARPKRCRQALAAARAASLLGLPLCGLRWATRLPAGACCPVRRVWRTSAACGASGARPARLSSRSSWRRAATRAAAGRATASRRCMLPWACTAWRLSTCCAR